MKFINGMKDKIKKALSAMIDWAMKQIDTGKKKNTGVVGWIKTGLLVLGCIVAAVVAVSFVVGFVLFCYSLPGLLFGTSLWLAWTWAGIGSQLFPQLDPAWLTLNWTQFFWITMGVYWLSKLLGFRKKSGAGLAQPKS